MILATSALLIAASSISLCAISDVACRSNELAAELKVPIEMRSGDSVLVIEEPGLAGRARAWVFHEGGGAQFPGALQIGETSAQNAFHKLMRLSQLDGQIVSCGVKDGIGYLIDGLAGDRRFSLSASNPFACEHPEAKAVADALAPFLEHVGSEI